MARGQKTTPIVVRTGEPVYCCLMMDYALDEGYLHPTILITQSVGMEVAAPHINAASTSKRNRKPGMLVNYCPWCGVKVAKETPSGEEA